MNSPATRARTTLASACDVHISTGGWSRPISRHAVDLDGSILLAEWALADCPSLRRQGVGSPAVTLTATDVCPVPQRDRVRGRVTLTGTLRHSLQRPAPGLLEYFAAGRPGAEAHDVVVVRFFPAEVVIDGGRAAGGRVVGVAIEDYTCAPLDPLVGWEQQWISHLDEHHGRVLRELARTAHPGREITGALHPLRADAHGLVVRHHGERGAENLRIAFAAAVDCGCEAVDALNTLVRALPFAHQPPR